MKVKIMRKPSMSGDEGRDVFCRIAGTLEEAYGWIASQDGGFLDPSHYFIVVEPDPPSTQTLYPPLHSDDFSEESIPPESEGVYFLDLKGG